MRPICSAQSLQLFFDESYGGTIAHYPSGKVVMTDDHEFPGYGRIRQRRMTREQLVELRRDLRAQTRLPITTGALVTGLSREADGMLRVDAWATNKMCAYRTTS